MLRVFIGFDRIETVAAYVLAHSLCANSSVPLSITFLRREQLPINPERDPLASTDFADTRFLVPFLSDYTGWSVFMDCDMVCTEDIKALFECADPRYAVMVRKHDHQPTETTKFHGYVQTKYERKNWSSLMLFNNAACTILTPDYVNDTRGLDLHQFAWCNDDEIGDLPRQWNMLAGYDDVPSPALIHYTQGGPWFYEYRSAPLAHVWFEQFGEMLSVVQRGTQRPASGD